MTDREFAAVLARLQSHWFRTPLPDAAFAAYAEELRSFPFEHVDAALTSLIRQGKPHLPLAGEVRAEVVRLRLDPVEWPTAIRLMIEAAHRRESWRPPERCLRGNVECDGEGFATRREPYGLVRVDPAEIAADTERILGVEAATIESMHDPKLREAMRQAVEAYKQRHASDEPYLVDVAYRCECFEEVQERRWAYIDLHPILRAFVRSVGWNEIEKLRQGDRTVEAQVRGKYEAFVAATIEQVNLAGLDAADDLPRVARARRGPLQMETVGASVGAAVQALERRTGTEG